MTVKEYVSGIVALYADGGCIGRNPSRDGGTWAYRLVDSSDSVVRESSGVITPDEAGLETITNNYTELLAVLCGFSVLPNGWEGTVYTDSNVTRCRLLNKKAGMAGIPDGMQGVLRNHLVRFGSFKVVLLDGHPTASQLALGVGKRGNPVSAHNVACDRMCREASVVFLNVPMSEG